jgi:excisionase family DNA binding protein
VTGSRDRDGVRCDHCVAPVVPRLFTPEEASAYIGGAYSAQRLKRLAQQHRITHVRIGRYRRFRKEDLDQLIERNVLDSANFGRGPRYAARL